MSLSAGSRLGPYEIVAPLGAGGMGEVYRARDTRLGREVAIKVLPAALAGETERLARFKREAQLLASLNHPGIAAIYGLEEAEGKPFLVLELVEGEDLALRLKRGAIPVEEALAIARQIAEALEAAHDRGIVHRDLKPANVKVTPDGKVKLLDFGLAKAYGGDAAGGSSPDLSHLPTLARTGTEAGLILGTAAYMSPEQARGKPVEKRADIWAFGVVVFEMLSGRRLFAGETVSDTLAAVLRQEIDWTALPTDTPAFVRRVLRRCLERDPKQRLHDVGDARLDLESARDGRDPEAFSAPPPLPRAGGRWRLALALAGALALAVGGLAGLLLARWGALPGPSTSGARPLRVGLHPPVGVTVSVSAETPGAMTPSPDGTRVVFGGMAGNDLQLYVMELATGRTQPLEGTAGGQYAFWSPDSRWIAFFNLQDGTLRKIKADGGAAVTVCPAVRGKGGTWNREGTIVFAPSASTALFRVPAAGGSAEAITAIDTERHNSHRHPRFLPDGKSFLYLARSNDPSRPSAVMVGSLEGKASRELFTSASQAEFASGHLLFVRDGTVFAQPFDDVRQTLSGEALPLVRGVEVRSGASLAPIAASQDGLFVYHTGGDTKPTVVELRDREGKVLASVGEPLHYWGVAVAPGGRRAVGVGSSRSGMALWILDLERKLRTQLTQEAGDQMFPVWSRDGRSVYYASNHRSEFAIYRTRVGQLGEPEAMLTSPKGVVKRPTGITSDGRALVYEIRVAEDNFDLWLLPLEGEKRDPRPLLRTPAQERHGVVSPDARWLAYVSNESGRMEVYVAAFPGLGERMQASFGGGQFPAWRGDGAELFYVQEDGSVMAVAVRSSGGTTALESPRKLFTGARPLEYGTPFSVNERGDRFLVLPPPEGANDARAHLIVDWPAALDSGERSK